MAESAESNWIHEIIDNIKNFTSEISNFFTDIINSAKTKINERFWTEIFKVTSETQKELNNLWDDILKLNELDDKKISENEKKILDKLLWNEKIKNYFVRLKDDSIWEELLNIEKEKLLQIIKNVSNNDSDNKKSDLTKTEMNNIVSNYESKLSILNSVLDDENIKNKDPKVTKKQVLEIYNNLVADKKATKENIIAEINKTEESSESSTSNKSTESES